MAITTLGQYRAWVSVSKNIPAGGSVSWSSQYTGLYPISTPAGGAASGSWSITATPAAGYSFSGWNTSSKTWSNTAASGSSANISYSNPNSATTTISVSSTWVGDASKTYSNDESVSFNVMAIFVANGFKLNFSSNDTSKGTVSCSATSSSGSYVNVGTNVTLTATAKTHYHFDHWQFSGGFSGTQTANPVSFGMPAAAVTAVAYFVEDSKYTVTVKSNSSSYGTVSGGGNYYRNDSVTVTATPKAGYHFTKWDLTGGTVVTTAVNPYSFSMPNAAVTATATFATNTRYACQVKTENSNKGSASGGGSIPYGASVTATATAVAGYEFDYWTRTGSDLHIANNPYTFTMPEEAVTLTAYFKASALGKYRVRLKVESENTTGGTISAVLASDDSALANNEIYSSKKNITVKGIKAATSKIKVSATPKSGFVHSSWDSVLYNSPNWKSTSTWAATRTVSSGNTYYTGSATWIGDTSQEYDDEESVFIKLIARFNPTLTIVPSPAEGAASYLGGGVKEPGSSGQISATAATGYHFKKWEFSGASWGTPTTSSYTYSNFPYSPVTATAYFDKNQFTVRTEVSPSSTYGSITGGGAYAWGDNVTVSATPNTGYKFVKWEILDTNGTTVISTSTSRTYTFEMPLLAQSQYITAKAYFDFAQSITLSVEGEAGDQCTSATAQFRDNNQTSIEVGVLSGVTVSKEVALSSSGKGDFLEWRVTKNANRFDGTIQVTAPSSASGTAVISLTPSGQLGDPSVKFTAVYQGLTTLDFPVGLFVNGNQTGIASASGSTGGSYYTSPGEYDISFPVSCTLASGYSFAGWVYDGHTADGVSCSVSLTSAPSSRSGNMVFHVVLSQTTPIISQGLSLTVHPTAAPIYTITYKANGGVGDDVVRTKNSGETITILQNQFTPAPGQKFKPYGGWNTKADGTGTSYSPRSNYSADANLTLYAQWVPSAYELEWDLGGGEYPTDEQLISQGFVKKQWSGGSAWSKDSSSYTYIYNPVGSINYDNSQYTITEGLRRSSFFRTSLYPSKTGYTFEGWNITNFDPSTAQYNDGSTTYNISSITGSGTSVRTGDSSQISRKDPYLRRLIPIDQSSLIGGGVVFTARYSANEYDVTLDYNDGSGVSENVVATYGSALPRITPPKRKGFTFLGYFDQREGGTKYYTAAGNSQRTWNKTSDTTLYAQWEFKWGFIKRFIDNNAEHCIICKGIKRWNGSSWDLVPLKKKETNDWSDPNE